MVISRVSKLITEIILFYSPERQYRGDRLSFKSV